MAKQVSNVVLKKQYDTERTIYATWTWTAAHTEQYELLWQYYTGGTSPIWFVGSETTSKYKQATYDPPENAIAVSLKIKPVAENKKQNNQDAPYWTASWSTAKILILGKEDVFSIETPSAPEVTLSLAYKYETEKQKIDENTSRTVYNRDKEQRQIMKLTSQLDIYTKNITHVEFQVVMDHSKVFKTALVAITKNHAAYTCNVSSGSSYKVRVRAVRQVTSYVTSKTSPKNKKKQVTNYYSDWSEYSQLQFTAPGPVTISRTVARTVDGVFIGFKSVPSAESYECEYTLEKKNFDRNPSEVKSVTVEAEIAHSFIISGLESNKKWYFRVRAVNSVGNGPWTAIFDLTIGSKPEPPTTWVNIDSAVYESTIPLFWTHNCADMSEQTMAEIYVCTRDPDYVAPEEDEGAEPSDVDESIIADQYYTVEGSDSSYDLIAGEFLGEDQRADGLIMEWKVRTMGATKEYGDWSVVRTIVLYSEPTVSVGIYPDLNWYWDPFRLIGGDVRHSVGDATRFVRSDDPAGPLWELVPIEPKEIVDAFPIVLQATAYPLTQPAVEFTVSIVSDSEYDTVDDLGNVRNVQPGDILYFTIIEATSNQIGLSISAGDVDLDNNRSYTIHVAANMASGLTAEAEYNFTVGWGVEEYSPDASISIDITNVSAAIRPFCLNEFGRETSDVLLSVYRRDYDGRFILIAENLDAGYRTSVIDPHPPLDSVRYRIVAKSKANGDISFYDMPPYNIGENAAIIQWDEEWFDYNIDDPDEMVGATWAGSIVRLPYNIDVTEEVSQDVELVNYAGRENPVSYYGTIKNESSNWSLVVPYDDRETIYALRRLSKYPGDVYIREPGGIGYWAKVTVTIASTHDSPACTVTIGVNRVEGGV